MPKRGENIHLRKDGRWEGRLPVKTTEGSKFKSVYGRSYREVKQKMQTMAANLNTSQRILRGRVTSTAFGTKSP